MTDYFREKYPRRMAVIDMGSNSIKMVCYAADHTGKYAPYHRESFGARLDEHDDGMIREESVDKVLDILQMFRNTIQYEGIDRVTAVATSAMRRASNRGEIVGRIQRETGFEFLILPGREEALYSYIGAATHLEIPDTIFFDIGGGSVDIVSVRNHTILYAGSVQLGALVMTNRFAVDGDLRGDAIGALRDHVRQTLPLADELGVLGADTVLVGVGGTMRAMARYAQSYASYPLKKSHNYTMDSRLVQYVTTEILYQDAWTLGQMYEIGRGRADIIKAGAVVVEGIMETYNMGCIRVSGTGLREGVLTATLWRQSMGSESLSYYEVREMVRTPSWMPRVPKAAASVVNAATSGLLSAEDATILQAAASNLEWLRTFRDADDFLYHMLDMNSSLSHRVQLLSAFCLIYTKKSSQTKLLMRRYASLLHHGDDHMVKRLSSIMSFCDAAITAGADTKATLDGDVLSLEVQERRGVIPEGILHQKCRQMGAALGVQVECTVYHS